MSLRPGFIKHVMVFCALCAVLIFTSCGGSGGSSQPSEHTDGNDGGTTSSSGGSTVSGDYLVLAWNDLGMHCLNPTYDEAVILPPYNNLVAQVVRKGSPPEVITSGVTVEYSVVNNTYSSGKRSYGQFWTYVKHLFGVDLAVDTGLNLSDSTLHNGLSGQMAVKSGYFTAEGIPVTPVDDSGTWNPYQVAEITVKDSSGATLAQTRTTVPVSDEINCAKCHGSDALNDVITKHDSKMGTSLASHKPVLCARCHGSPALGQSGAGSSGKYLSQAIHGSHAKRGATCYDCHPGETTKCNRSSKHTDSNGKCTTCHGDMTNVASAARTPWVDEPKCATCHSGVSGVDTGSTLYRHSTGHGGLYCSACHGSPHAMVPSTESSDNYQALQYQGKSVTIGSCAVCHGSSRGGGGDLVASRDHDNDNDGGDDNDGDSGGSGGEFYGRHGGANPRISTACNICHTSVSADTTNWPHAYQWKSR